MRDSGWPGSAPKDSVGPKGPCRLHFLGATMSGNPSWMLAAAQVPRGEVSRCLQLTPTWFSNLM